MQSPTFIILQLIVLFFGIGLHEYAHCKFSDMAGDDTARLQGRVTLNLFKHFDPLGAIFILFTVIAGFGFGWGKPAPFNPRNFRNPRWDIFATTAAGPLANVLQAMVYTLVYRLGGDALPPAIQALCLLGVLLNLGLTVFNLIPIFPLDGHWIVGQLLPPQLGYKWYAFQRGLGPMAIIILVIGLQFFDFSPSGVVAVPAYEALTGDHGLRRLVTIVHYLNQG